MIKSRYLFGIVFLGIILIMSPDIVMSENIDNVTDSIVLKLNNNDKLYKIDLAEHEDYEQLIIDLENEPQIDFVLPNHKYELVLTPNDTHYSSEWYLDKINAPTAWDFTTGSNEVIIAVLDTGVDIDHPDLLTNIWINTDEIPGNGIDDDLNGFIDDYNGWDFVGEIADPNPKFDSGWTESGIHHGSVVAGTAAAIGNNGLGVAGLTWNVKIMPVRVLDSAGVGDTRDVYEGINYAVNNGADFINLSFVGNNLDTLLENGINNAWLNNVTIFAAAGNDNIDMDVSPRYPVCNEHIIGVGGVDQNDVKWSRNTTTGSNYGACVDIVAPATGFISTAFYDPSNSLNSYYLNGWSGTSLSTPLVSAAAALAKSFDMSATPDQIIQRIYDESVNINFLNTAYTGKLGNGRLDLVNIFSSPINTTSLYDIITGLGAGSTPQVKVFQVDGTLETDFLAYVSSFEGGVSVAAGDLDGDGIDEIVTGVGNGGGPQVRTFDRYGNIIFTPGFFAYGENFRGGVNVAVGDLDGDGLAEIIAGAGNGGGPQVRTFDRYGVVTISNGFFAYDLDLRGGVKVNVIKRN
ncbi:MAG: S8 family serine peptidase [Candidatus Kerfeldbacteria bacterium]